MSKEIENLKLPKRRRVVINQIDWEKSDIQLSKETGFSRGNFSTLRRVHALPFCETSNHSHNLGIGIENWVQENLLPQSLNLNLVSETAPVDLYDAIYGFVNVKAASLIGGKYTFSFKDHKSQPCDYFLLVCLADSFSPEKCYLINSDYISFPRQTLSIYPNGNSKYSKFLIPIKHLYSTYIRKNHCFFNRRKERPKKKN